MSLSCCQCAKGIEDYKDGSYVCVRAQGGSFGLVHPKCFPQFLSHHKPPSNKLPLHVKTDENAPVNTQASCVCPTCNKDFGTQAALDSHRNNPRDSASKCREVTIKVPAKKFSRAAAESAATAIAGTLVSLDVFNAVYAVKRGRGRPKPSAKTKVDQRRKSSRAIKKTAKAAALEEAASPRRGRAANSEKSKTKSKDSSIAKIEAYHEKRRKEYLANKEEHLENWSLGPDDLWCRYCGAQTASGFSAGPWGSKKLCTVHYVQWKKKKQLEFTPEEAATEPTVPICLDDITSFAYLARMDVKFYKDGDTNIPALNEVKMTKEERQKAKEEEKQRKKKAKEARRLKKELAEIKAEADRVSAQSSRRKPKQRTLDPDSILASESEDDSADMQNVDDEEDYIEEEEDASSEEDAQPTKKARRSTVPREADKASFSQVDPSNIIFGGRRRSRSSKKKAKRVAIVSSSEDEEPSDDEERAPASSTNVDDADFIPEDVKQAVPAPFLEEALIVHGRRRRKKVNYAEVDESDEEAYYAEDPDSDAESTPRSSRGRSKDGKKRKHKKKKKKKKKSRSYNSSSSEPEVML